MGGYRARYLRNEGLSLAIVAMVAIVAIVAVTPGCTGGDSAGTADAAPQRLEIEVIASGYRPETVEAEAGRPILLVFRRTTEESCGATVVFPGLGIQHDLPLNETVEISLAPQRPGKVDFACAMDMMHGAVVVR